MQTGMIHAHSGLRWILLILLIITVINAYMKWKGEKDFTSGDDKLSLWTMMVTHIQLLLGLYLFFTSGKVMLSGLDMANAVGRFYTIEHTLGMMLAIVLITLGRVQAKKIVTAAGKHKKIFTMFLIALLIILLSIPWPFRDLGASWF
ncbi:MAG: cytochrome B [Bacteroidia bacterium]|nr:cytochrome B [Bacteroidia bacterium]